MKSKGIYKITNPNNEVYIGQAVNLIKRENDYKYLEVKCQPKIYKSLLKYGWDKHKFEIIEICPLSKLDAREVFYKRKFIKEFGWDLALFCRIRDKKGGHLNQETKQKIREALVGIKRTNKTLNKMILSKKNMMKSILQYDLKGNLIREWDSLGRLSRKLKIRKAGVCNALKGRCKSAYGYKWKYKNDK
jgi:hypothetical protein